MNDTTEHGTVKKISQVGGEDIVELVFVRVSAQLADNAK